MDIAAAIEQGRYIALDAAEALSTFMMNDLPDPVRFLNLVGDRIVTAAKAAEGGRVAAFGECVDLLLEQGKAEAVVRLEQLWNEISKSYNVDILCGYHSGTVPGGMDSHIFQRICAEHSAVCSRSKPHTKRTRMMSLLPSVSFVSFVNQQVAEAVGRRIVQLRPVSGDSRQFTPRPYPPGCFGWSVRPSRGM